MPQLNKPDPSGVSFDFTEEEVADFLLSGDLLEVIQEADLVVTDLSTRKKLRMETYVREMAVFDGAIKQTQVFREHLVNKAKQKYADRCREVAKSGQWPFVRKRTRAAA